MIGFDVKGFVDWLAGISGAGAVILFLVGFQQGWWQFDREVKAALAAKDREIEALKQDRDEWRTRWEIVTRAGERMAGAAASLPPPTLAGETAHS